MSSFYDRMVKELNLGDGKEEIIGSATSFVGQIIGIFFIALIMGEGF